MQSVDTAEQIASYTAGVMEARQRMQTSRFVERMLDPEVSADFLMLFLIHYCSLGVHLTRPVEGWIHGAGERCLAIGLHELGKALLRHAKHEAGHHELMIRDTHALVAWWNQHHDATLDPAALLDRPPTAAGRRYIDLHEQTIAGPAPYGQLAIEYEIEQLAVLYVPTLIQRAKECFGTEVTDKVSFLVEHAELDVGHTHYNEHYLSRLVAEHPEFVPHLAAAGSAALDAYAAFFAECIELAAQGVH